MAKKFEDYVFEYCKNSECYNEILHDLKEIRRHMIKHPAFARLSIVAQVEQCCIIGTIVSQTCQGNIQRFSIFNKGENREPLEYDIRANFKDPDFININPNQKLLNNKS